MKKNKILLVAVVACVCATFAGLVYAACNAEATNEEYSLDITLSTPPDYACKDGEVTFTGEIEGHQNASWGDLDIEVTGPGDINLVPDSVVITDHTDPAKKNFECTVSGFTATSSDINDKKELEFTVTIEEDDFQNPADALDQKCEALTKHELIIIKVDIVKPEGSLTAAANPVASWIAVTERFDFQGIVAGASVAYDLDVEGDIDPIPPASYQWTLDAAAGTLADDTTATPVHAAPAAEGEGILTLKAIIGGVDTGCWDERRVKIYKDCLARDRANFGTGGSSADGWEVTSFNVSPRPVMGPWNCHGSTYHLNDGSGDGDAGSLPAVGDPKKEVQVTPQAGGGGTHPSLGTLNRGDIVAYYTAGGVLMHSQTCTGNGTETYGANNEPMTYPGAPAGAPSGGNESFKWATSTAGDWANDLYYPDWTTEDKAWLPTNPTPIEIKVYDKP